MWVALKVALKEWVALEETSRDVILICGSGLCGHPNAGDTVSVMNDQAGSGYFAVTASADSAAFPTLTPAHLTRLSDFGDVDEVGAGESLFREGQRFYGLIVVLEGSAEIVYVSDGRVLRTRWPESPQGGAGE